MEPNEMNNDDVQLKFSVETNTIQNNHAILFELIVVANTIKE